MGNLKSDPQGLITRIALGDHDDASLAGLVSIGVSVSLRPVAFDLGAWLAEFDRLWPAGSAAAESYRNRLVSGTSLQAGDLVFPRHT
jgi:hypothetical protein